MKLPIAFVLCIFVLSSGAQNTLPSLNVRIEPPPNSSAIAFQSEIPVQRYTGVPNIGIDVITVSGRKLKVPIRFNYHASGIRVRQESSWIGLGWSLGAGGIITRTVRGLPDDKANGFMSNATSIPDYDDTSIPGSTPFNLIHGTEDMTPDMFYLSINGGGGKFVYGNDEEWHFIPRKEVKVNYNAQEDLFTIISGNGAIYKFGGTGAIEVTQSYQQGPDPPAYTSTWYLTEMISDDLTDTISFTYSDPVTYQSPTYKDEMLAVHSGNGKISQDLSSNILTTVESRVLEEIIYTHGKIVFSSSNDRSDLLNSGFRLNSIKQMIKNPITGGYNLFKEMNLYQDYFVTGNGGGTDSLRLRLDSLKWFAGTDSLPPYRITYNAQELPAKSSFAQDHWGFYNGQEDNSSLLPRVDPDYGDHIDREPNTEYVQAGILSTVQYPSGGFIRYQMEINQYHQNGQDHYGGGLRVKRIIEDDIYNEDFITTEFEYKNPFTGNSSGSLDQQYNYVTSIQSYDSDCNLFDALFIHAPQTGLGTGVGSVSYEYVTEIKGGEPEEAGKTVFKYKQNPYVGALPVHPFGPITDHNWARGHLLERTIYKYIGSGQYRKVTSVQNSYKIEDYTGVKGLSAGYEYYPINNASCTTYDDKFEMVNTFEFSKFHYLSESKSTVFDPSNDSVSRTSIMTYYYDSGDLQLDRKEILQADSTLLRTEYKYTRDFTGSVYDSMIDHHMYNTLIESKTLEIGESSEDIISYKKTDFKDWGNNIFAPEKIWVGNFSEPVPKTSFDANTSNYIRQSHTFIDYDNFGNLLESKPSGDLSISSIYGYEGSYLIASVDNASTNQIAYTGFEDLDLGNWNLSGSYNIDSTHRTGKYSLQLGTGISISKTNLPVGTYVLQYWENSGNTTVSLSGSIALNSTATLETVGTWSLIQKVLNVTGSTNSLTLSGTNLIDELRLYPESAVMSTSSIDLVNGVIDTNDASGRSSFSEFDDFGRPVVQRDHFGQINRYIEYFINNMN